jgi:hypothetical protein
MKPPPAAEEISTALSHKLRALMYWIHLKAPGSISQDALYKSFLWLLVRSSYKIDGFWNRIIGT